MTVRHITLALQGGGAHGAFTWGVLDRILEEKDLEIDAISGTSAGAINAAVLKIGLIEGGRKGARAALRAFWELIDRANHPHDSNPANFWPDLMARTARAFTPQAALESLSYLVSPYDFGPFYLDPLRHIVETFRLDSLHAKEGPTLFVSATNVRTGKIRVFSGKDITIDALMASACLPTLFRAVEIDDPATGRTEAYWDGGFSGNPALFPLYAPSFSDDLIIVNINPICRAEVPDTAGEILNRMNEIGFNIALLSELRAINFAHQLIEEGKIPQGAMKNVRVHMIADDPLMNSLSSDTKMRPTTGLIEELYRAGRKAAGTFLRRDGNKIGKQGSVDLAATYS